nr:hypothetical protein [uncultured Tyzzerella sp.]
MISNRLLFKEEFKKYIWALALTILFFLSSKIVIPLLDYSRYINMVDELSKESQLDLLKQLNGYITLNNYFNKVIVIILALVVALAIFSYLHDKRKVDFYHSLPIYRTKLFFIKYFLGIFIVIPVMIITHFMLYGIFKIFLGSDLASFKDILEPLIADTIFFITIYSIAVFATILCGNTTISVILSFVLINLYSIIVGLIILLTVTFFNGDIDISYLSDYILKYNPVIAYFNMRNNAIYESITNINFSNLNVIITYSIISILIVIFSLFLFKIRKSENATSCIAFKYAKTILKYLGVCIGGILIGLVFKMISESDILLYIGIIIGCIILHCIIEIIYDFDFRAIFKNWYSIIPCLIISIVIVITYQFDIFKRLDYVPNVEKIESVNIRFNNSRYYNSEFVTNIENLDSIEAITELNKINNQLKKQPETYAEQTMRITYKLKNGSVVSRNVGILHTTPTNESLPQQIDLIKQILNDKEYIEKANPILYMENVPYNAIDVTIHNNKRSFIEKVDNKKLIETIKKDIEENGLYSTSENTLFSIDFNWDYFEYRQKYGYTSFYITDKYKNTLSYLASLDIYPENFNVEDVKYIDSRELNVEITEEEDIKKILDDYKCRSLLGFINYKKPIDLTLVTKNDIVVDIYISQELYEQLSEKYGREI